MELLRFALIAFSFVGLIGAAALPAVFMVARAEQSPSKMSVVGYVIAAVLISMVTLLLASNALLAIMRSLI